MEEKNLTLVTGPAEEYYTSSTTPFSDTPILFLKKFVGSYWLYVYIILAFELSFRCILFNSTVFSFYVQRLKFNQGKPTNKTYYLLYVILSMSDMWVGVTAFIHGLALILLKMKDLDTVETLCYVLHFMTAISNHVSIFLNVIISVIRTVHIVLPTRTTSKRELRVVYASIILYTLIWIVLAGLDSYYLPKYRIASKNEHIVYMVMIAPRIFILHKSLETGQAEVVDSNIYLYAIIAIGIPYVLPALICIVCSVIQGYSLLTSRVRSSGNINKRITTTIVILTACFFFCKIPYLLYFIINLKNWSESSFIVTSDTVVCYFIATFPNFINAFLNPTFLILRGRSLRKHTLTLVGVAKEATIKIYSVISNATVVNRS